MTRPQHGTTRHKGNAPQADKGSKGSTGNRGTTGKTGAETVVARYGKRQEAKLLKSVFAVHKRALRALPPANWGPYWTLPLLRRLSVAILGFPLSDPQFQGLFSTLSLSQSLRGAISLIETMPEALRRVEVSILSEAGITDTTGVRARWTPPPAIPKGGHRWPYAPRGWLLGGKGTQTARARPGGNDISVPDSAPSLTDGAGI